MDQDNRITQLEDEIKVLKNEMLAVLFDVRETLLSRENPFSAPPQAQSVTIAPIAMPAMSAPSAPPAATKSQEQTAAKEEAPAARASTAVKEADIIKEERREPSLAQPVNYEAPNAQPAQSRSAGNGAENALAEMVKGWRAAQAESVQILREDAIGLDTLTGLIKWVENTSTQLGPERAQTILDISEMMGHMPEKLKQTVEKFIVSDSPATIVEEKVATRTYLTALKDLAKLLGKDTAADYLVLQIVSNGLTSMGRKQNG
jgi:hypothetical protein